MKSLRPTTPSVDSQPTPEQENATRTLVLALAGVFAAFAPKPTPEPVKAPEPEPAGLQSAARFARHIQRSVPTVHRLREEGMPAVYVGNSWRFPVAECVAWLAARGKKPTVARAAAVDSIDVSDVVRGNGLREVG